MKRLRLDQLLVQRGLFTSREQAQASILAGEIWSGEVRMEKAGSAIAEDLPLEHRGKTTPFVGRAGQKLHHALKTFGISVEERVCLDVGASTGGFTDCLVQSGAKHVFAVDVGYGQIDSRLRKESKISVIERCNARYLNRTELVSHHRFAERLDFICMDVSFISLRKIVEPLRTAFPEVGTWVLLFKPQFEVGQKFLGKGGKVRSDEAVQIALREFSEWIVPLGFKERNPPSASPIAGKKSGNVEYLLHYETL